MANSGLGFFDKRGEYFPTPEEASVSDLSSLLGRIGEGDSLAPGIAAMLLEKRAEIERIFVDHDDMTRQVLEAVVATQDKADNVAALPRRK